MAIKATTHAHGLHLTQNIHGGHVAVAVLAVRFCRDMDVVREVDIVGGTVDAFPDNRFAFGVEFAQHGNAGTICRRDAVAVHTRLRRRDRGKPARFHAHMAILAIDFHVAGVDFVGEVDRLLRCIPHRAADRLGDEGGNDDGNERDAENDRQANLERVIEPCPEGIHSRSLSTVKEVRARQVVRAAPCACRVC